MTPASSLFYVFVLFISLFFYHNTNALSTHMQIFCKTNIFLCFLAYCSHSNGILLLKKNTLHKGDLQNSSFCISVWTDKMMSLGIDNTIA